MQKARRIVLMVTLCGLALTLLFPWQAWQVSTGKPKERPTTGDAYKDWLNSMANSAHGVSNDDDYIEHFTTETGMRGYWLVGYKSPILWPRVVMQAGALVVFGLMVGLSTSKKQTPPQNG